MSRNCTPQRHIVLAARPQHLVPVLLELCDDFVNKDALYAILLVPTVLVRRRGGRCKGKVGEVDRCWDCDGMGGYGLEQRHQREF